MKVWLILIDDGGRIWSASDDVPVMPDDGHDFLSRYVEPLSHSAFNAATEKAIPQ